jgi:hypothetical protein
VKGGIPFIFVKGGIPFICVTVCERGHSYQVAKNLKQKYGFNSKGITGTVHNAKYHNINCI